MKLPNNRLLTPEQAVILDGSDLFSLATDEDYEEYYVGDSGSERGGDSQDFIAAKLDAVCALLEVAQDDWITCVDSFSDDVRATFVDSHKIQAELVRIAEKPTFGKYVTGVAYAALPIEDGDTWGEASISIGMKTPSARSLLVKCYGTHWDEVDEHDRYESVGWSIRYTADIGAIES
ncbi:MAG TPA: hypothetical protein VF572_01095 [Candidatus Saccharimonadales bacterium]|jgi:hypothetical protein